MTDQPNGGMTDEENQDFREQLSAIRAEFEDRLDTMSRHFAQEVETLRQQLSGAIVMIEGMQQTQRGGIHAFKAATQQNDIYRKRLDDAGLSVLG